MILDLCSWKLSNEKLKSVKFKGATWDVEFIPRWRLLQE